MQKKSKKKTKTKAKTKKKSVKKSSVKKKSVKKKQVKKKKVAEDKVIDEKVTKEEVPIITEKEEVKEKGVSNSELKERQKIIDHITGLDENPKEEDSIDAVDSRDTSIDKDDCFEDIGNAFLLLIEGDDDHALQESLKTNLVKSAVMTFKKHGLGDFRYFEETYFGISVIMYISYVVIKKRKENKKNGKGKRNDKLDGDKSHNERKEKVQKEQPGGDRYEETPLENPGVFRDN